MEKFEDVKKQVAESRSKGVPDVEIIKGLREVGYDNIDINEIMREEKIIPVSENIQDNKKSSFVKMVIAVAVLLAITGGSVFAYMQVNPFFLKSKEQIFNKTINNTSEKISQGNFVLSTEAEFILSQNSNQYLNVNFPVEVLVSKINENGMSDVHLKFGDLDTSEIFDFALGGLMGAGNSEMAGISNLDNNLNFELKLFQDGSFLQVNSIPQSVNLLLPIQEILDKYESNWISFENEFVKEEIESVSGADTNSLLNLLEEDKEYILDRLINAILVDSKPIINAEKNDIGLKIDYSGELKNLSVAINSALKDIVNNVEQFNDIVIEDMDEEIENISGIYKQTMIIDDSFVINSLESIVEASDGNIKNISSIKMDYDFDADVEITKPESKLTIEELMEDVMMLIFFSSFDSSFEEVTPGSDDSFSENSEFKISF